MKKLVQEKELAIKLRRQGLSYKEILKQVPVAKSSLSLWLKEAPLTSSEKRFLKTRTDSNISKGRIRAAAELSNRRLERDRHIAVEAKQLFDKYKHEPLFQVGTALYWAEGAKRSDMFQFVNSDVAMIETMLCWVERYIGYKRDQLGYRLYVHKAYAHENLEQWWQQKLQINTSFKRAVLKKSLSLVKRRPEYRGCLRVEVPKSGALLKTIKCWINLLVEYHRE